MQDDAQNGRQDEDSEEGVQITLTRAVEHSPPPAAPGGREQQYVPPGAAPASYRGQIPVSRPTPYPAQATYRESYSGGDPSQHQPVPRRMSLFDQRMQQQRESLLPERPHGQRTADGFPQQRSEAPTVLRSSASASDLRPSRNTFTAPDQQPGQTFGPFINQDGLRYRQYLQQQQYSQMMPPPAPTLRVTPADPFASFRQQLPQRPSSPNLNASTMLPPTLPALRHLQALARQRQMQAAQAAPPSQQRAGSRLLYQGPDGVLRTASEQACAHLENPPPPQRMTPTPFQQRPRLHLRPAAPDPLPSGVATVEGSGFRHDTRPVNMPHGANLTATIHPLSPSTLTSRTPYVLTPIHRTTNPPHRWVYVVLRHTEHHGPRGLESQSTFIAGVHRSAQRAADAGLEAFAQSAKASGVKASGEVRRVYDDRRGMGVGVGWEFVVRDHATAAGVEEEEGLGRLRDREVWWVEQHTFDGRE